MTTDDRNSRVLIVKEVARRGASPAGILLALHLFGLQPCPGCGYVHDRCRCPRADSNIEESSP